MRFLVCCALAAHKVLGNSIGKRSKSQGLGCPGSPVKTSTTCSSSPFWWATRSWLGSLMASPPPSAMSILAVPLLSWLSVCAEVTVSHFPTACLSCLWAYRWTFPSANGPHLLALFLGRPVRRRSRNNSVCSAHDGNKFGWHTERFNEGLERLGSRRPCLSV